MVERDRKLKLGNWGHDRMGRKDRVAEKTYPESSGWLSRRKVESTNNSKGFLV